MRQLFISAIAFILIVVAVLCRRRLWQFLRAFWTAPDSPLNLSIFRIVLFTTILLSVDVPATVWFSQMPPQLRFPPLGLRGILPHIPITPQLAHLAASLLLVFSFLAAIGLLTRVSAALTAMLALYAFGLPHFYGKVNHLHHHLIWFATLMAVSPCADVLSVDAIIRAWRRKSRNHAAPSVSLKYGLPLRFVWVLMGVIYFFPGFWKLWHVGPTWASGENMKLQMFAKWSEFGGWVPSLGIYRHPALCALVGAGTVVFELSFLFLVFFRRCRPWLVVAGLAFHNLTGLFMRIWFAPLQPMYVALVDWDSVSCRFRKRFGRGAPDRLSQGEPIPAIATATGSGQHLVPIIVVGTALLLSNIALGIGRFSEGWPLACYPLFDSRATGVRQVLTVMVENHNGESLELDRKSLSRYFPPDRERGLEESLLRVTDPARRKVRLKALWQLWLQNHPELRTARSVRFYHDTISTIPGEPRAPLRRELLESISNLDD
jgi:hypothetical protein